MPRDDDPRVMVRLDPVLHQALKESARRANVAMGALIRECAERAHEAVAADVAAGTVRLRRARVEEAEAAAPVVRARTLVQSSEPITDAMRRQMAINAQTERARKAKS